MTSHVQEGNKKTLICPPAKKHLWPKKRRKFWFTWPFACVKSNQVKRKRQLIQTWANQLEVRKHPASDWQKQGITLPTFIHYVTDSLAALCRALCVSLPLFCLSSPCSSVLYYFTFGVTLRRLKDLHTHHPFSDKEKRTSFQATGSVVHWISICFNRNLI